MSVYHRSIAKGRILQEYGHREEEIAEKFSRQISQKEGVAGEKRIRREIANSNERRRMQSINAGFQVLRSLLPQNEGEKLSKAAILQQTTELIRTLQQDKAKILAQNAYFKQLLNEVSRRCKIDFETDLSFYCGSPAQLKRKKRDTVESSDEGITADYFENKKDVRQEVVELRKKLDQEQQLRKLLEMQATALDFNHYEEKSHQIQPEIPKIKFVPKHDKPVVHEEQRKEVVPARVPLHIPLHLELEADHTVPSSPQHRCQSLESKSSSMSRRNLETIVEAIRHLEGEELSTSHHVLSNPHVDRLRSQHYIEHGEENENLCVISDPDDLRSESSGRDSPSSQPQYARLHSAQNLQHSSVVKSSSTKVTDSSSSYFSNRYPAVTNVLQGNSAQMQLYYRPDVIVQKF